MCFFYLWWVLVFLGILCLLFLASCLCLFKAKGALKGTRKVEACTILTVLAIYNLNIYYFYQCPEGILKAYMMSLKENSYRTHAFAETWIIRNNDSIYLFLWLFIRKNGGNSNMFVSLSSAFCFVLSLFASFYFVNSGSRNWSASSSPLLDKIKRTT